MVYKEKFLKKNQIKKYLLYRSKKSIKNYNYIYSLYYPIYIILKNIYNSGYPFLYYKSIKYTLYKNRIKNIKYIDNSNLFMWWIEKEWLKIYVGKLEKNKNIAMHINSKYGIINLLKKSYKEYKLLITKINVLKYYYMYMYKKSYINFRYIGLVKNKLKNKSSQGVVNIEKINIKDNYVNISKSISYENKRKIKWWLSSNKWVKK